MTGVLCVPGTTADSCRTAGPAPRASGRPPGAPVPARRWVPPSERRLASSDAEDANNDNIFRKVRGILNKLTPEKFQKLSDDLLALQLDSDKVLKGVILLIFEKALDEPKYSSMYAQLCKRLSEEAPNLEPPPQPCTFKLLLLNKCRAEFENRAQAFAAFEDKALTPEEEEKRHLAKCKMLGNIKFIGELGKLEILAESILHRCIQKLLARRAAADHHEDLECLAQLVRTCGRVLDSARGRGLMDQYFARIDQLSHSPDLQPRIRFMLRDVAELRRGGWVGRAATAAEGPVPIAQVRGAGEVRRRDERTLFPGGLRARPLDDVLAGLALPPNAPSDKLFSNGFRPDAFRQRSAPAYYSSRNNNHHYNNKQGGGGGGRDGREGSARGGGGGGAGGGGERKARVAPAAALHDLQMRPAANSLMFTANKLSRQPQPITPNVLSPSFTSPASLVKEPAIAIKPAPDKKDKPKKDKGVNKEEACRLGVAAAESLAAQYAAGDALADDDDKLQAAVAPLQALQLPDKVLRRVVSCVLEHAVAPPETEGTAEVTETAEDALAWAACSVARGVRRAGAGDALRALLHVPRAPRLHALLAHAVLQKLITLSEVGGMCEGGARYPLLLDVLRVLRRAAGSAGMQALYDASKLNIIAYVSEGLGVPEALGGGEAATRVLAALEGAGLAALAPALRVQAQLALQLQHEPQPHQLYRWIKANVEPSVRGNAAFVAAVVELIAEHVSRAAGGAAGGAASGADDKAALERERALVEAYAPLLSALLAGRPELQLAAVYAAQLHAHRLRYPKGLLLRWFMYLYNLEVCEEDAFLRWREDVTDAHPGKGQALFQVNTWLTWLQQQDSTDEDNDD